MSADPAALARVRRAPVAVVFGTRPEIVKLGHIIQDLGALAWTVHTGQHWDDALVTTFLRDLDVGRPSVELSVGGLSRGEQLGTAVASLSRLFARRRPQVVVVQGDTTTALAGALAANACDLAVVHVEAGLRSYDRAMPEEHNRVLIDHVADVCCVPTETSREQLVAEGVAHQRIVVTGNTVVEAVRHLLPPRGARRSLLHRLGLRADGFVLATFHRPENVDGDRLGTVLEQLNAIVVEGWPVVLPLHPRARARMEEQGLRSAARAIRTMPPMDYPTFLGLAAEAGVLVSDSGGLQEEACVLKRPIVVVRNSTERPEAIGTFSQRVTVGPAVSKAAIWVLQNVNRVHAELSELPCPYGDGTASRRCGAAIRALLSDEDGHASESDADRDGGLLARAAGVHSPAGDPASQDRE
jgi:UDP-N-acetylglucosamine 2-epimerase (non-hydrolysing)